MISGIRSIIVIAPRMIRTTRSPLSPGDQSVTLDLGTAFGIYKTVQINQIWSKLEVVEKKLIAFQETFNNFSKDIIEL